MKAGRSLDEQAGVIENELLERVEATMLPGASEPGEQLRLNEGPYDSLNKTGDGQEAGRDRERGVGDGWDGVKSSIGEGRETGRDVLSGTRVTETLGEDTGNYDLTTSVGLGGALQDIVGYLREQYYYCLC